MRFPLVLLFLLFDLKKNIDYLSRHQRMVISDMKYHVLFTSGRQYATETFVLISEHKNWTEAQRYCREHHTDLVSIRNHKENRMIANMVGFNFAWIGIYRTRIWSDQSNSSFRYWKAEEPYVNLEHLSPSCTAVSLGGRWTEESCNITLPFICYTGESVVGHQIH